jgi:hypothetical protein
MAVNSATKRPGQNMVEITFLTHFFEHQGAWNWADPDQFNNNRDNTWEAPI